MEPVPRTLLPGPPRPYQPRPPGVSALVVVEAATPEKTLPPGLYTPMFGPEDGPSLVLTGVTFP
jgi:hypothetical protein